jgi:Domain of unknown function (DUF4440)
MQSPKLGLMNPPQPTALMINNTKNAASFTSIADFISDIEITRTRALIVRDMASLWQLHAPDYQLITPPGRTYTRERYLGEVESGTLRYLRWEHGAMNVRVNERIAIVRYQGTLELDSGDGHGTPFSCWHTDSYELENDVWRVVWSQATAIK